MSDPIFQNVDLSSIGLAQATPVPTKKNDDLKEADFLALLVAQLENQNPMEPQDNAEFVSQLSQFGMLDGIKELNTSFNSLAASISSSQALQASSLVGQQVVVEANRAPHVSGETFYGTIDLPASVGDLILQISDNSGSLIKREHLGAAKAGTYPFKWDGTNDDNEQVPSGSYKISALATIDGNTEEVTTNLSFNVDSVTLGKNGQGLILNLAGRDSVSMDEVKEIR